MGVNKIINSPVVNKLKICDLKSSRSLKYTAIIIIAITTRVNLYINQNIILIFNFGCETGFEPVISRMKILRPRRTEQIRFIKSETTFNMIRE